MLVRSAALSRRLPVRPSFVGNCYSKRFLSSVQSITSITDTTAVENADAFATAMDASPIITDSTSAATAIGKAALQYGDFKAIGLCNYTPPGVLERLFEALYISAGLPWWATIASSCLLIRGVLAPFTFNNFRTTAVMRQIQPEVKELMSRYQTAKQMGDQEQSQFYMKQLMDLYALHGVQPAAPLGTALLTAPIFISFFMSLDKMTKLPVESFREGGLWWFQDLTVPDPYYILPITASAIFLSNIHFGVEGGSEQSLKVKRFFQIFTLAATPFMAQFPAALSFYWCVNGVASMGIAGIQRVPAFRRWWGIPDVALSGPSAAATGPINSPNFMDAVRDSMQVAVNPNQKGKNASSGPPVAQLSSSEVLREALRRQHKAAATASSENHQEHHLPSQQRRQ